MNCPHIRINENEVNQHTTKTYQYNNKSDIATVIKMLVVLERKLSLLIYKLELCF